MSRPARAPVQSDDHDALVDEVLAAAGGDVRAAFVGLVLGQQELRAEAARTVSAGYVRRQASSGEA